MGIDKGKLTKRRKKDRTHAGSENVYLRALVKIYKFLNRRAPSAFNRVVMKRLISTGSNRPNVSTSRLHLLMRKCPDHIAVVVGPVTNDTRRMRIRKMTVCALRFTKMARAKIEKAGGTCMSFDQLAMTTPLGSRCTLIRGKVSGRKVWKQRGAPGVPGSHSTPKLGNRKAAMRGRKHEKARGRRNSRQWKVKT
eukprot:NODE_4744_length_746_cov_1182.256866_g4583_i0.p1 GENE.NODE_4744_length_746_cov_1182.256866_g4583_i0~~NODE_4744_length_746_cov_1182.256866_g4583_i0.p1  ORF type:complete len:194 (-),score=5.78 NODE_4744_length_746_cov_1182.256866_g4583_i0:94-675(-)